MYRFCVVLLLLTTSALAQQTAADTPATRDDVLRLFSVMNINEQMRTIMDSMMRVTLTDSCPKSLFEVP